MLGMALGGAIAAKLGWRWSFAGMALFGLCLAVLYPIIVKEARIAPQRAAQALNQGTQDLRPLRTLWSSRSVVATYHRQWFTVVIRRHGGGGYYLNLLTCQTDKAGAEQLRCCAVQRCGDDSVRHA